MEYFAQINDTDLRVALVESLRTNRRAAPGGAAFHLEHQQLVYTTVLQLAKSPGVAWASEAVGIAQNLRKAYEGFYRNPHQVRPGQDPDGEMHDVERIEAIIWELIAQGIIYPRFQQPVGHEPRSFPLAIRYLVVTDLGQRYLETGALHPAAPDFVTSAIAGLDDIPSEVRAALEDAQLCFQHRLLRAAVVQLGLAYEGMAAEVYGVVVGAEKPREAKDVLKKIREAVARSKNEMGERAVTVADEIRAARNTAAHDWQHDFTRVAEVETLLILGGRNVRAFWDLHSPAP